MRSLFPSSEVQSGQPSEGSMEKVPDAAPRRKSRVSAQEHEALKQAKTSINQRRGVNFARLRCSLCKMASFREKRREKKAAAANDRSSFNSVRMSHSPVTAAGTFPPVCVCVCFSFRRGGRDLGCKWRQAEGGNRELVVAADISHPVFSYWLLESSHSHPV